MPIVRNGRVAAALRYIDADGVEHQVVQVRLGDRIVFDGTTPALASVQRFTGSGQAFAPLVQAGQSVTLQRSTAVSEFRTMTVGAGARIAMPTATAMGDTNAPSVTTAVRAEILAATASGSVLPAAAGEVAAGVVHAPAMTATGSVLPPVAAIPATVDIEIMTAVGEMRVATVCGRALAAVIAAAATGQASAPGVHNGQRQELPRSTATGKVIAPIVTAGARVVMPVLTAVGSVAPAATAKPSPAGMDKSGTQFISATGSVDVTGFVVRSGFPATVISDDKLVASAPMTVTFTARVGFTSNSTQAVRVIKNGSEVVATGIAASTITGTVIFSSRTDTLSLQVGNSFGATVTAGPANTYLYWNVVG